MITVVIFVTPNLGHLRLLHDHRLDHERIARRFTLQHTGGNTIVFYVIIAWLIKYELLSILHPIGPTPQIIITIAIINVSALSVAVFKSYQVITFTRFIIQTGGLSLQLHY